MAHATHKEMKRIKNAKKCVDLKQYVVVISLFFAVVIISMSCNQFAWFYLGSENNWNLLNRSKLSTEQRPIVDFDEVVRLYQEC